MKSRIIAILSLSYLISACSGNESQNSDDAINTLSASDMKAYVKTLASDEFQGRKPFTEGEVKTIEYLQQTFKEIGLEPGNGDSYLQEVPMVEITAMNKGTMTVKGGSGTLTLQGRDEYILNTERTDPSIVWEDDELVIAGLGVVASE